MILIKRRLVRNSFKDFCSRDLLNAFLKTVAFDR